MAIRFIRDTYNEEIQVFGAGMIGKKASFLLMRQGYIIKNIVDNDPEKYGKLFWDKVKTILPGEADKDCPIMICLENISIVDEVYSQLKNSGFRTVLRVDIKLLNQCVDELSDREYLTLLYYIVFDRIPDLENPVKVSEKMQWLKIHDRNPLYVEVADKYRARDFISKNFGDEYLIPLRYMTYDCDTLGPETIPSDGIAIKSNCSSGDVELFRAGAEIDYEGLKKKFKTILSEDYSRKEREWWYSRMRPCIVVEKLLLTSEGKLPNDYKFHFFNGELQFIYCSIDREGENYRKIYSPKWEELPFSWNGKGSPPDIDKPNIPRPVNYELMIEMGERIAQKITCVRVDYYEVDGVLYFGEITVSHGGGFDKFIPEEFDSVYGKKLKLPQKIGENISNYLERFNPYHTPTHTVWVGNDVEKEIIKLDWNEAVVPVSELVKRDIKESIARNDYFQYYPNIANGSLDAEIARYLNVNPQEVLVFPSSDAAHESIAKVWIRKGDKCGIVWPSYDNFRATMELADASVLYYEMEKLVYDLKEIEESVRSTRPRMVYLCNPNNPTGTLLSLDNIRVLLDEFNDVLWIIDEAYGEFADTSSASLIDEYANLVITRTFSKAFGLANLRIGYIVSAIDNIRLLSCVRNPKNISTQSQIAAIAAIEDRASMERYVFEVKKAKEYMYMELNSLAYVDRVYKSYGNYIMIALKNKDVKEELLEYLYSNRIYIRDLAQNYFLKERCVRITIGPINTMKEVVDKMKAFQGICCK